MRAGGRVNRSVVWVGVLVLSFLPVPVAGQEPAELDEHLRFLEPLIGPLWEGGFLGEGADLVISLHFEPVLSGRAVKYTREAAELGYVSETHLYWSPVRKEVIFLTLNTRGIVGEGAVSFEDGAIVLRGVDQWPDGSVESRTVWQLDEDGVLRDTFTRLEGGEWVQGHVQEFRARGVGALDGR